jgi:hypothetical protein
MPSAWISRRGTKHGVARYRVEFRVGGRETATRYGGSFKTKREADERKPWVVGELAARRVPELRTLESETVVTLRVIAERWKASRVDVAEGTMQTTGSHSGACCRGSVTRPSTRSTLRPSPTSLPSSTRTG